MNVLFACCIFYLKPLCGSFMDIILDKKLPIHCADEHCPEASSDDTKSTKLKGKSYAGPLRYWVVEGTVVLAENKSPKINCTIYDLKRN